MRSLVAMCTAFVFFAHAVTAQPLSAPDGLDVQNGANFQPPYPDGHWATINPDTTANPPVYFNISDTPNVGNPLRPNTVMNFGHNLNSGAGPVDPSKGFFGIGLEGHYEPTPGEAYFEAHLYMGNEEDGIQRRPWSWRIDKHATNANSWTLMQYHNQNIWFEPYHTKYFAQFSPGGFVYNFHKTDNEPSGGFGIEAGTAGGTRNTLFYKAGIETQDLVFQGWRNIVFPNGASFNTNGDARIQYGKLYVGNKFNVDTTTGLIQSTGLGAHYLTAAGAGEQLIIIGNTAAGVNNAGGLRISNDITGNAGSLTALSSSNTAGGKYTAGSVVLEATGAAGLTLAAPNGTIKTTAPIVTPCVTVATLLSAPGRGARSCVTNALSPSFLSPVVGGGAVVTPVFYNGSAWVAG